MMMMMMTLMMMMMLIKTLPHVLDNVIIKTWLFKLIQDKRTFFH